MLWTDQVFFLFQIRSDFESDSNIHYSLEGIGANQYPFHVFVVDPKTGLIRVTQVLDRELVDTYNVSDAWKIRVLFAVVIWKPFPKQWNVTSYLSYVM